MRCLSKVHQGDYKLFLHWPTSLSVLAIGLSMTYMKKHTLNDNELGKMLRENMALSGWILFMLNAVLIGGEMHSEEYKEIAELGPALIRLVLNVQYGYIYGIIFETFFTRDVRKVIIRFPLIIGKLPFKNLYKNQS